LLARVLLLTCATTLCAQRFVSVVTNQANIDWQAAVKPVPVWGYGMMVAYDSQSAPPRVYAFNPDGAARFTTSIEAPGLTRLLIHRPAPSPSGEIVVPGTGFDARGLVVDFLLWITKTGQIGRLVRTNPFHALKAAFAEDGTLWTAGVTFDDRHRQQVEADVLRRFDAQGTFLLSALPSGAWSGVHPATNCLLAAGGGKVVFYSRGAAIYTEVSAQGEMLLQLDPPEPPSDMSIDGLGVTASGVVFLTGESRRDANAPSLLYQVSPDQDGWMQVSLSNPAADRDKKTAYLVGVEGEELVFRRGSHVTQFRLMPDQ